ncbi:MAG: EamA family transporter [Burkholderiaceae bacterium]
MSRAAAPRAAAWPALALVFNAFTWGVSWWPFRELQARGLHPLWATAMIYVVAAAALALARPAALREVARHRGLWMLVLGSGFTNAAFNWGVTIGDVVRVVLLFYLMPLWALLLARLVLREPLGVHAVVRVALALGGAAVVLWPDGGGWPLPRTPAEWLGVAGGFSFALNNVMLRHQAHRSEVARGLAMFVGGATVAGALAATQAAAPALAQAAAWAPGAAALALWFVASNLALQFGAARLRASTTAVVMVSEVLFASVSAIALGAGTLGPRVAIGGALIVLAAVLAAAPGAQRERGARG